MVRSFHRSPRVLARRHGISPKTLAKWKRRTSVAGIPTGPKDARSTVLSTAEEAIAVAFRRRTLLPLDDCLCALQPTVPHLNRSSLHRCLQRHGISPAAANRGRGFSKAQVQDLPDRLFSQRHRQPAPRRARCSLLVATGNTSSTAPDIKAATDAGEPAHSNPPAAAAASKIDAAS
jgi:hypothetical protein